MKITRGVNLKLKTSRFTNVDVNMEATIDTNDKEDLRGLGLGSDSTVKEAAKRLQEFVEYEVFETKNAMDGRPIKDFKLSKVPSDE